MLKNHSAQQTVDQILLTVYYALLLFFSTDDAPLGEIHVYLFLKCYLQADMAFNFTLVCTSFYAVIASLNRDCILADPPIQNFLIDFI